ncbi:hypothetical protein [Acinetobacter sp. MD2(2019)]|uniref:hypothetical protein n=1 Tax=Acinetobacter sp. MD2(2019) TaxID=2605273 RepID=UPI002D1F68C3|nr:hypothetical protein [Acinetobacter sp. MD2(2019)]MEB3754339.1 hypothetical protein [Acinetobacter sp. MD2(2019)]
MKPRYLVYCLCALSISGCSQHFLQPVEKASLEQRSAQAMQSIYNTSGFDYQGQMRFEMPEQTKAKIKQQLVLDDKLGLDFKNYMRLQGIATESEQFKSLEQSLQKERALLGLDKSDSRVQIVDRLLQDLTFSYDGGVDYRAKLLALNLSARYDTKGLLIQAKYPMILDLQNTKFYTDFSSLAPFMVSAENRNQLTYLDFAKYRSQLDKVDLANLVDYIKQSTAVPFMLAKQDQLSQIALSEADKKAGGVEKIRFNTDLEALSAQLLAYARVNQEYLSQHIVKPKNGVADAADTASTVDFNKMSHQEQADWATEQLEKVVEAPEHEYSDETMDSAAAEATAAALEASEEIAAAAEGREDDETALSRDGANDSEPTPEQCSDVDNAKPSLANYAFCLDNYDINVLSEPVKAKDSEITKAATKVMKVAELFKSNDAKKLTTADQFKTMWNEKQTQVDAILPKASERHPLNMDMVLDRQGRLVQTEYDMQILKTVGSEQRPLQLKAQMQISNYGKPKAIDRAGMQKAKPVAEVIEDSRFSSLLSKVKSASNDEGFEAELKQLAVTRYAENRSYLKTYQMVYGALFAESYPEAMKKFSAQEVQNLATLMAYRSLAEEGATKLTAQEKAQWKHLERQYPIGESRLLQSAAATIVMDAKDHGDSIRQWQQIIKNNSSVTQRFAKGYIFEYQDKYGLSQSNAHLQRVAEQLAKFYVASKQQKIDPEAFKSLTEDDLEYLESGVFKDTYLKMLDLSQ